MGQRRLEVGHFDQPGHCGGRLRETRRGARKSRPVGRALVCTDVVPKIRGVMRKESPGRGDGHEDGAQENTGRSRIGH